MGVLIAANDIGIGCAGWALRAIISEISYVLQEAGHLELAAWLTDELSPVQLYAHLDVRDLKPENQKAFLAAVGPAYDQSMLRGPAEWPDPAFWEGYAKLFSGLAEQAKAVAGGHSPTSWPNLSGIDPHDGSQNGPGW